MTWIIIFISTITILFITALPFTIICLLRMKTPKNIVIHPKFAPEANRLIKMGYQIISADSEHILLEKQRKRPWIFTIVAWLLLLGSIGWFLMEINIILRYFLRVRIELWDVNGRIVRRI